jgi:hypothetical protein
MIQLARAGVLVQNGFWHGTAWDCPLMMDSIHKTLDDLRVKWAISGSSYPIRLYPTAHFGYYPTVPVVYGPC